MKMMERQSNGLLLSGSLIALTIVFAAIAHAGNMSFLKDSAIEQFNDEDIRLMIAAVNEVVADQHTPAKRQWKNEATGNYGSLQTAVADNGPSGEKCKRLRVENHAGSRAGKSTYTMCDIPPDGWRWVPSDFVPKKSP
jgi:hypothetical protein